MRRRLRFWGRALILLGVSAWIPYFVLKYLAQDEVSFAPFLVIHLSGVIPGALLARGEQILQLLRKICLK